VHSGVQGLHGLSQGAGLHSGSHVAWQSVSQALCIEQPADTAAQAIASGTIIIHRRRIHVLFMSVPFLHAAVSLRAWGNWGDSRYRRRNAEAAAD